MQAYFFLQLRLNIKPIFACDHLVAMRYTRGMRCGELPEAVRSGFVMQPENQEDKGLHSVNSPSRTGVLCRETHTHTQFFQSVVSSADLSTDRSTSPYNRSLVSRRPLHRHGPSAVSKASPRDDQVADHIYLQSRDTERNLQPPSIEL